MSLKGRKYIKDTFCIAPWTEVHFGVKKDILPCCTYNSFYPFGNLNENDELDTIYNSEKAKNVRRALFNGDRIKECDSCWLSENISKNESYRQFHNKYYGQYIDEALENTNEDFSLKKIKIRRLDIRYDNKCNLKCRICNSDYSTSWFSDEILLGLRDNKKIDVYKESIPKKVFDFIIEQLPNVDEIFFAGGEPLMQDGHYTILEKAIELGINKKIRLTYNTNFSSLKYKNKDIISLWKQFEKINIGASLDASHERGEYQRKNIKWDLVIENRKKIINELPNHEFTIIPTLNILNVYNILDFHREWLDMGLINVNDIKINLLSEPLYYNIKNLPEYHKKRIIKKYTEYNKFLNTIQDSKLAQNEFAKIPNFLKKKKNESDFNELKKFIDRNVKLDKIRDESFFDIFIEYSDLEYYIKYEEMKNDIGKNHLKTIGSQKEKIKKSKEYIRNKEIEIDNLNKKLAEKDSFISKALHDKSYIIELETLRDELNSKLSEKDSFIAKTLHDKSYVNQLENLRDELSNKLSEKDSFISKTLHDKSYVNQLETLRDELKNKDIENIETFFDKINDITKRLETKIKNIKKENSYKSLL